MVEKKYGKYIKKDAIEDAEFAPSIHFKGADSWKGLECSVNLKCFTQPHDLETHPHAHDYDQLLFFMGSNPLNIKEFHAEVKIFLGEEQEEQTINSTSIVYIPKGLIHCPLYFKKVEKPVVFINIALTGNTRRSLGEPPPTMEKRY